MTGYLTLTGNGTGTCTEELVPATALLVLAHNRHRSRKLETDQHLHLRHWHRYRYFLWSPYTGTYIVSQAPEPLLGISAVLTPAPALIGISNWHLHWHSGTDTGTSCNRA